MVNGLDLFREHFRAYADRYVLIGGTACDLAMREAGIEFRATKDFDMVLCIEVLDKAFVQAFWKFVGSGTYQRHEKSARTQQHYRFQKPQASGYPFMPEFIRSDNGPEFIAQAVRDFLEKHGGKTAFVAPGAPWENAYSETFNSRLGDELLKRELFMSLGEAKVLAVRYRTEYNEERPHSALGYKTPAAFAACCVAACSASLRTLPHNTEQKERLLS